MPANNPLDTVTFGHTTEACKQSRRRFRGGVAAEVLTWLDMLAVRYTQQRDTLPRPQGAEADKWITSMVQMLDQRIAAINIIAGAVTDKFSVHEWNAAVERINKLLFAGHVKPDDFESDDEGPVGEGEDA